MAMILRPFGSVLSDTLKGKMSALAPWAVAALAAAAAACAAGAARASTQRQGGQGRTARAWRRGSQVRTDTIGTSCAKRFPSGCSARRAVDSILRAMSRRRRILLPGLPVLLLAGLGAGWWLWGAGTTAAAAAPAPAA